MQKIRYLLITIIVLTIVGLGFQLTVKKAIVVNGASYLLDLRYDSLILNELFLTEEDLLVELLKENFSLDADVMIEIYNTTSNFEDDSSLMFRGELSLNENNTLNFQWRERLIDTLEIPKDQAFYFVLKVIYLEEEITINKKVVLEGLSNSINEPAIDELEPRYSLDDFLLDPIKAVNYSCYLDYYNDLGYEVVIELISDLGNVNLYQTTVKKLYGNIDKLKYYFYDKTLGQCKSVEKYIDENIIVDIKVIDSILTYAIELEEDKNYQVIEFDLISKGKNLLKDIYYLGNGLDNEILASIHYCNTYLPESKTSFTVVASDDNYDIYRLRHDLGKESVNDNYFFRGINFRDLFTNEYGVYNKKTNSCKIVITAEKQQLYYPRVNESISELIDDYFYYSVEVESGSMVYDLYRYNILTNSNEKIASNLYNMGYLPNLEEYLH